MEKIKKDEIKEFAPPDTELFPANVMHSFFMKTAEDLPLITVREGQRIFLTLETLEILFYSGKAEPLLPDEVGLEVMMPIRILMGGKFENLLTGDKITLPRVEAIEFLRSRQAKIIRQEGGAK